MQARDKLYFKENKRLPKLYSIDESNINGLLELKQSVYDADISMLINVAIEEYIEMNPEQRIYYYKNRLEQSIYRKVKYRVRNLEMLNKIMEDMKLEKDKNINITRVINSAIKQFLENIYEIKK